MHDGIPEPRVESREPYLWQVVFWTPPALVVPVVTFVAWILPVLGSVAGGHGGDPSFGYALMALLASAGANAGLFLTPFAMKRSDQELRSVALVMLVVGIGVYIWVASIVSTQLAGRGGWIWEEGDRTMLQVVRVFSIGTIFVHLLAGAQLLLNRK